MKEFQTCLHLSGPDGNPSPMQVEDNLGDDVAVTSHSEIGAVHLYRVGREGRPFEADQASSPKGGEHIASSDNAVTRVLVRTPWTVWSRDPSRQMSGNGSAQGR